MPTSGGLGAAVRNGKAIGCTAVQVFTSSPRQWDSKDVDEAMVADLQAALAETGMQGHIVSHDSYLINLCAPAEETRDKSRRALARELDRCGTLGIPYVVSHMGSHMKQGEDEGLRIVAEETKAILRDSPESVTLLMETTAGQGTALFYTFDHFKPIFDAVDHPEKLGICLDTCHIHAAGYDISHEEGYEGAFSEFAEKIGLDRLKVIHCNDSKNPAGSRKDRHEHLGEGMIGEGAFRRLVNDDRFTEVPILVETPGAEEHHATNVKRLWDWQQEGLL